MSVSPAWVGPQQASSTSQSQHLIHGQQQIDGDEENFTRPSTSLDVQAVARKVAENHLLCSRGMYNVLICPDQALTPNPPALPRIVDDYRKA